MSSTVFPNLDQEAIRKLYNEGSFREIGGKKGATRKLGGAVKGKPKEGDIGEWKVPADWVYLYQPNRRVVGPRNLLVQYLSDLATGSGSTPNMAGINAVIDEGVSASNAVSKAQVFVDEAARSKAAAAADKARLAATPSTRSKKAKPDDAMIKSVLRGVEKNLVTNVEPPKKYDAEGNEIKATRAKGAVSKRDNVKTFANNITEAMRANEAAMARRDPLRTVYNVMGLITSGEADKIGTKAKKESKFNPDAARDLVYVEGLPIVVNRTKSDALAKAIAAINLLKRNGFGGLEPYEEAFRTKLGRGLEVTAQLTGN